MAKRPTLRPKGLNTKEKAENIAIRGRSTILVKMKSSKEIDTLRTGRIDYN